MRLNQIPIGLVLLLVAGCASPVPNITPGTADLFPKEALITQRGVLTVFGRQFTLNGYLSRSTNSGMRLIVTENFGKVLADVLVKPDGATHVIRSSEAFRADWIQKYIASDLKCIFGDATEAECPVRILSPMHFFIQRRWYKLDLHVVEVKAGPQSAEFFDETLNKTQ